MWSRSSESAEIAMQTTGAVLTPLRKRWQATARPLRVACVTFPTLLFCGLAWIDYQLEFDRTRNDVATATTALAEHAQTVVQLSTSSSRACSTTSVDGIGQISARPWKHMTSYPACATNCRRCGQLT
jgi:hypothetical protein